jgi:hypothetical protein
MPAEKRICQQVRNALSKIAVAAEDQNFAH